MEKVQEEQQIDEQKAEPFNVIQHKGSCIIEGNMRSANIHKILCDTYEKLFRLHFNHINSFSYKECNILIDSFPIITYGINHVTNIQIPHFLRKATNIDQDFNSTQNNFRKVDAQNLEKIIFSDLQLFLNFYKYKKSFEGVSFWKKSIKFLYQPLYSIRTYYNDLDVINELESSFNISTKEEVR
jgi:hypothetical protein